MSNLSSNATGDAAVILGIVYGMQNVKVSEKEWDNLLVNDRQRKTNNSWYLRCCYGLMHNIL